MPNEIMKDARSESQSDQDLDQRKRQGASSEELAKDLDPALSLGASINEGLGSAALTTRESREQAYGGESSDAGLGGYTARESRDQANGGGSSDASLGSTARESREQVSPAEDLHRDLDRKYFGATAVRTEAERTHIDDEPLGNGGRTQIADEPPGGIQRSRAPGKIAAKPYAYMLGALGLGLAVGHIWNREAFRV